MIIQHLNWAAVAVSAIAYFMLGAIWFNPKIFGAAWMKGHGITAPTDEEKKRMPVMMGATLLLCLIGATAVGYFCYAVNSWDWMTGAKIGAVGGTGLAGTGIAMNYMYTRKSLKVIAIDSSYHIAGMMICGIILSVWRYA